LFQYASFGGRYQSKNCAGDGRVATLCVIFIRYLFSFMDFNRVSR
jgi:hypothetical protein